MISCAHFHEIDTVMQAGHIQALGGLPGFCFSKLVTNVPAGHIA